MKAVPLPGTVNVCSPEHVEGKQAPFGDVLEIWGELMRIRTDMAI